MNSTFNMPLQRKIIHLDMDCFYAAVEMRERPELANKPLAVGGSSPRGVVTTCNYIARDFGVRSAMPGFKARELCPHIVFVPVRHDLYRQESERIRKIMLSYTTLVEPLSLDEAYLDVSHHSRYAWDLAKELRRRIFDKTGLTASAGIAPNKMLAKIASDWRKPNGQFAVLPNEVVDFMSGLPIRKIWGIGPKSATKFESMGIHTCGDLQRFSKHEMVMKFGKQGEELFDLCRGHDYREVDPSRERKSLSNERTFSENLGTLEQCRVQVGNLFEELEEDLAMKAATRSIHKAFVKIKFSDFTRTTKECVCNNPNNEVFQNLLCEAFSRKELSVRLLGVGVRFVATDTGAKSRQYEFTF